MEQMKEFLKGKIGAFVIAVFVLAFVGIYYFKDPTKLPMDTFNSIIMIIVGYLFGSSKNEDKPK